VFKAGLKAERSQEACPNMPARFKMIQGRRTHHSAGQEKRALELQTLADTNI